jgi:hypothetical protein
MENFDEIWSDVIPVPQDDAVEPVVAISYAPGCKQSNSNNTLLHFFLILMLNINMSYLCLLHTYMHFLLT